MADSILSEPAHTRFNISGPPLPFNGAAAAALSVALDSGDVSFSHVNLITVRPANAFNVVW